MLKTLPGKVISKTLPHAARRVWGSDEKRRGRMEMRGRAEERESTYPLLVLVVGVV